LPPWIPLTKSSKIDAAPIDKNFCHGCGAILIPLDYPDLCLWCSKQSVLDDPFGLENI